MSATNSGVTPESGVSYVNQFLFYSRDQAKGPNGEVLATGQNSVMMDMNTLVWVSKRKMDYLGGALFSMSATIPIANNSLTSDIEGGISGGGGLADSYYQPFILGWRTNRADIRGVYGFLAPSGRFNVVASNNLGSGYWTHAISSGQTFYLSKNRATAISAFQMYEIHMTQQGTQVHPGDTLNLDYSLTHVLPLQRDLNLQVGLVGYEQWQLTDKPGPGITHASHLRTTGSTRRERSMWASSTSRNLRTGQHFKGIHFRLRAVSSSSNGYFAKTLSTPTAAGWRCTLKNFRAVRGRF